MIAPHRDNRKNLRHKTDAPAAIPPTVKVERLFAWLQNFRCPVVRYEYHQDNFLGFVHLGCILLDAPFMR
jgi:transposase